MREITGRLHSLESLHDDLTRLGLRRGMSVIAHTSFKSLGHVIGGPASVILALESAVTTEGSLLMPTFTENLCDPSTEENRYPEEYWDQVRGQLPIYQPDLSPTTRTIGIVPEVFRKQDGVVRSSHPHVSFAAWGRHARQLAGCHSFHYALGEGSPIARLYDLDGWILLLGCPRDSNTSLHLAEYRLPEPMKRAVTWDVCMVSDGKRTWTKYDDIANDCADFPRILADYSGRGHPCSMGKVGNADCVLVPQRRMVDFGVEWMIANRK